MTINKRLLTSEEIDYLTQGGPYSFGALEAIAEAQDDKTARILLPQLGILAAKVQFLVNHMDKQDLLDDHSFTFPDGDTWTSTKWEVANA